MTALTPVPRAFYDRDTVEVAHDLLGAFLVHNLAGEVRVGKIVEVEAYLGESDLAAHSSKGLTPRTRILFGPPGFAYVYLIYGIYCCMNVVTEREGNACAVLLRALEPVQNLRDRTQGPGLLCRAMGIDLRHNGHDLVSADFFIAPRDGNEPRQVVARPRVGVDYSGLWASKPLSFYLDGNPYISRK
ncbi:DNA-3-methyladenine glycosylase [Geomonas paludis]|uniref:Putative 3-methyladenine DNA glycosylase n=1 Tax=Geomonas paludis TaxID=2740185 RepID=A0A6V8MZM8_9BACT|nr:DNA-3-methyladenine glycosylase [Geomonas paludis]UPU34020.1 DNA-3-methyladenine glycosylase [Geomonas paludis]GFO65706.1 putative 3-methyladenine DNA glycosylase [Geomonas paludis]